MKNRNKTRLVIVTLGLVFAFLIINSINIFKDHNKIRGIRNEPIIKTMKNSGAYSESFIHIDGSILGNWSATTGYPWCYVDNGIYIIENVTIDASSSSTGSGIFINNSKDENFIIRNCIVTKAKSGDYDAGIKLENTNNGFLINNTCSNNKYSGILLFDQCYNNTLSGNTVNNNEITGIYLYNFCDNNTISGNIANNVETTKQNAGIWIRDYSDNNTISGNTVSNNFVAGIVLNNYCANNTITGNLASKNGDDGGIYLLVGCVNNTISGNTVNENIDRGINLEFSCSNNTISDNYILINKNEQIYLAPGCNDNIIKKNIIASKDDKFIIDYATGTQIGLNYYLPDAPSLCVDIVGQLFSITKFIITINISSGLGFDLLLQSIQMWWNGIDVPSNNIINLGNGLYNISLTPIFVELGEDPILLNMTISDAHHLDKYFETYIAVHPNELVEDILEWEIVDQSFSTEQFNITFFIHNTTGSEIDFATFQIWWNGVGVSTDVRNLGNGYYFISLEPITIILGEDPILLNMTVSAMGYQDKYFETYIAVQACDIVQDTLELEIIDQSFSKEEFNIIFFVHNTTGVEIDFAMFQIWWNGTEVSDDIRNFGNGYYFISLEPITVAPGDDPILLSMNISADGYEDKQFETYLAVDPETLEKGVEQGGAGFPFLIFIIALISAAGGIGATLITIVILRKRRSTKEVI